MHATPRCVEFSAYHLSRKPHSYFALRNQWVCSFFLLSSLLCVCVCVCFLRFFKFKISSLSFLGDNSIVQNVYRQQIFLVLLALHLRQSRFEKRQKNCIRIKGDVRGRRVDRLSVLIIYGQKLIPMVWFHLASFFIPFNLRGSFNVRDILEGQ